MTSANKTKGDVFERALRDFLGEAWFLVSRTRAGYERDYGDIHVLGDGHGPSVIFQAKNHREMRIGAWLEQTTEQRQEAGAKHGVLVVKRRGVGAPGRQYAVMELSDLVELLREAGYAE